MSREYKNNEEQIARYMKALAHPARVAIVQFLASQECCFFGDIHEVLPISKATVSQHLTELKNSGLIQGEIMPPKVKYCINKEAWNEAHELINSLMLLVNKEKKCCQ
ncbi:MAG: metalloregulator ArsR/SmtB family transcription factor [Rikenellaceae bacterium]